MELNYLPWLWSPVQQGEETRNLGILQCHFLLVLFSEHTLQVEYPQAYVGAVSCEHCCLLKKNCSKIDLEVQGGSTLQPAFASCICVQGDSLRRVLVRFSHYCTVLQRASQASVPFPLWATACARDFMIKVKSLAAAKQKHRMHWCCLHWEILQPSPHCWPEGARAVLSLSVDRGGKGARGQGGWLGLRPRH